jgi:hypothetical protein
MAEEPKNTEESTDTKGTFVPQKPTSTFSGLDNDTAKFSNTIEAQANNSLFYLRFFFSHQMDKKPYIIRMASNKLIQFDPDNEKPDLLLQSSVVLSLETAKDLHNVLTTMLDIVEKEKVK